ncbi:MAG: RcnB family protein [Novosphingobium sp.]
MAVKSNTTGMRASLIALTIAALAIPAMAEAAPERDRGWNDGRSTRAESAPPDRPTPPQQGQRSWSPPPQAQPPQQSQLPQAMPRSWSPPARGEAPQPMPPVQSRRGNWNGGDRQGGNGERADRGWRGNGAATGRVEPPPQQGGWNGGGRSWSGTGGQTGTPAPPPVQPPRQVEGGWNGERRGDRTGQGDGWRNRSGEDWRSRNGRGNPAAGSRDGNDSDRARHRDGDWRDGNWRQRDGSRGWNGNDRRSSNDGDWRSRVERNDRHYGGNRDYWSRRNWSNHWDRSRRNNWSGWNSSWNWTWGQHYHRWDRNWRSRNQYDWYGWRNRYPSYYQVGYYYAPYRGYSSRRLNIGFFLDALFFGEDYWIADPSFYRLPQAYGPYRWVRYYDDAVLVNIYTGEVVDVIYDFFW